MDDETGFPTVGTANVTSEQVRGEARFYWVEFWDGDRWVSGSNYFPRKDRPLDTPEGDGPNGKRKCERWAVRWNKILNATAQD